GSPVEMPWLDRVPAVLEGYLGGQAWGSAVADLLWGRTNPSGKLAETFPRRIEDTPGFLNFPGDGAKVEYREGVFVGYRYYDAAKVEPLFPFGHGMSYTEFKFGQLRIERSLYTEDEIVRVSVPISNAGSVAGGEVVQLYVSDLSASVTRPPKELKAFGKVFLEPGETSIVAWELDRRAFAFWSVEERRWLVETGRFELAVGSSSRDLRSSSHIEMRSTKPLRGRYDQSTALGTLVDHPEAGAIASALLEKLIPVFGSYEPGTAAEKMMAFFARGMPLRNVVRMTGGELLSVEACEKLCTILNRGATAEEIASLFPSW
ncbi:MAG: fibronectin type III-like domain-contianing protein, partial [Bacillota bacterium]|nr:fibronectin type III-like domain-contianing protein [Bacillota bacterium]